MVEPISISITAISLIKGINKAINEAKKTIESFNAEYEKLRTVLDDLNPRIQSVQKFDDEIADVSKNDDLTVKRRTEMKNLVNQLKNCQELVEKCAHLPFWKYHRIKFYAEKLKGCNDILNSFITRSMMADVWEVTMTNRRVKYECSVPEPPEFTVGWREPVGELKQLLLQDELPVIGICGPGGCGKSTLVKKLCQQVKGEFERISYIDIPRLPDSPNEKKEEETVKWIAIFNKLWDDLVDTVRQTEFESANGALEVLKQRLKRRKSPGKLLVVLDGVWSDSMLKKFLIDTPRLKTLVTSRLALEGLNSRYLVPKLTTEDAKALFLHHALPQDTTTEHVDDELVEKIVTGCKLHPLALRLIGASLKGAEFRNWKKTAANLHEKGMFKLKEEIYWPLKTSLDSLEKPVQRDCFLDLSCFPDNKRIRAAALMDIWVHTRGQDEDGDILKMLADRHLIELFQRTRNTTIHLDESFNDLFVAQPDLLSEFAVYVSKEEKSSARLIINQGDTFPDPVKEKDMISQVQIVSIHTGGGVNFDWTDVQLPRAEVLMLNFSSCSYCLPPFLNNMENLKVLIITNHNIAAAVLEALPPSRSLKSLRVVRLEKVSFPIHCTLAEPFKGVQKLSLVLCKVDEVLDIYSGFDMHTMFPDLTELEIDYCDGLEKLPVSICDVVNLRKLSITNCHELRELPEEMGSLSELEVLRLSACSSLERLPDSLYKLKKLRFLDLFRCSCIEELPNSIGMLRSLEKIDVRGCFARLPDTVINLEGLRDVICDEDAETLWMSVKTKSRRPKVRACEDLVSLRFLE
ncbi:unnamed protein product [Victoria cruziana]